MNNQRINIGLILSQSSPQQKSKPQTKRPKTGFKLRHLQRQDNRTNDEIHSDIKLCPVMQTLIDTRYFQRLRQLKQLGTSEQTYMNANHTRFEHSIGVAHLAKQMVTRLKNIQPNLHISDKDVLCVTLAGLLHDIGHGPYSHLYDGIFPRQLAKHLRTHPELERHYDGLPARPNNWEHENGSLMMIDALLKHLGLAIDTDNLDKPLKQIGDGISAQSFRVFSIMDSCDSENRKIAQDSILTSRDWIFIKEAILGEPLDDSSSTTNYRRHLLAWNDSGFVGRPVRNKEFLYDIVSNRHSGLDVDKIDYFARDERRTEKGNGEVNHRLIEEAVVAWGRCPKQHTCFRCQHASPVDRFSDSHLMIVWPVKCAEMACAFFHKRFRAHSGIYTHKTTQAATFMVSDILTLADPYFRLQAVDDMSGEKSEYPYGLPISRAMIASEYYLQLRDSIIDILAVTTQPELKKARMLINRLRDRKLYKCCGNKKIRMDRDIERRILGKSEAEIEQELLELRGSHDENGTTLQLTLDDFHIEKLKIHLGSKDENPLSLLRFVPKHDLFRLQKPILEELPEAIQVDESDYESHLPRSFQEHSIRVYLRTPEKHDLLSHVFELWRSRYDGDEDESHLFEQSEEQNDRVHVLSQEPETPAGNRRVLEEERSPFPSARRNLGIPSMRG